MVEIFWHPGMTLEQAEKKIILKALRLNRGKKSRTAAELGITHKTLNNKLKKYLGENKVNENEEIQDVSSY